MNEDERFMESFEAPDWARAFVAHVQRNPAIATDEASMIGWFANAIMRGWDEHARRYPEASRFAARQSTSDAT